MNLLASVKWARDVAYDFMQAKTQARSGGGSSVVTDWEAPSVGVIRTNVDAAFYANDQQGPPEWWLERSMGVFQVARARWRPSVANALLAEATACRDYTRLATERAIDRVVIETDSLCSMGMLGPLGYVEDWARWRSNGLCARLSNKDLCLLGCSSLN